MSSPKEKAVELMLKFQVYCHGSTIDHGAGQKKSAKSCAIIAVDEILSIYKKKDGPEGSTYINEGKYFWMQVKNEINKL